MKLLTPVVISSTVFAALLFCSPCVGYCRTIDWALGWSKTLSLGAVSPASLEPVVGMNSVGALHVLRFVRDQNDRLYLVHQETMNYSTFSSPERMLFPGEQAHALCGVIDRFGRFHLAWIATTEGGEGLFYTVFDPASGALEPPVQVSRISTRVSSPAVCIDSTDKAFVSWIESSGQKHAVVTAQIETGKGVFEVTNSVLSTSSMHYLQTRIEGPVLAVAWSVDEGAPDEDSVYVALYSLEWETLLAPTWVGTTKRTRSLPFDLFEWPNEDRLMLLVEGWDHRVRAKARYGLHLFAIDPSAPDVSPRAMLPSGTMLRSPCGVVGEYGMVHLAWVQEADFFDVWVGHVDPKTGDIVVDGCLSPHDGDSYFRPQCAADVAGELHVFWLRLKGTDDSPYELLYRNTVYPTPLSLWRRIEVPEKAPLAGLLFAVLYTAVTTPWLFVLANAGSLAAAFGATWCAKRFLFRQATERIPELSLILLFSLLFALLSPINPFFIRPPFAKIVWGPTWHSIVALLLASGFSLWIIRRGDLDGSDTSSILAAGALWTVCYGFLVALPGAIQSAAFIR